LPRLLFGERSVDAPLHGLDHRRLPLEHEELWQRLSAKLGLVERTDEPRFRLCCHVSAEWRRWLR
jgi:hypothetical protein